MVWGGWGAIIIWSGTCGSIAIIAECVYLTIFSCYIRLLSSVDNLCKQFRTRLGLTERRSGSAPKLNVLEILF